MCVGERSLQAHGGAPAWEELKFATGRRPAEAQQQATAVANKDSVGACRGLVVHNDAACNMCDWGGGGGEWRWVLDPTARTAWYGTQRGIVKTSEAAVQITYCKRGGGGGWQDPAPSYGPGHLSLKFLALKRWKKILPQAFEAEEGGGVGGQREGTEGGGLPILFSNTSFGGGLPFGHSSLVGSPVLYLPDAPSA